MYNLVNTVFMMNGSCTFREKLSEKLGVKHECSRSSEEKQISVSIKLM